MRNLTVGTWVWGAAIVLTLAFTGWYHNWSGPLTPAQIDAYMAQIESQPDAAGNLQAARTIRTFLQEDDGKEFFMLNVVKLHDTKQPHPQTGNPTDPAELLSTYSSAFLGRLLMSAGHPVFVADKTGPYVDTFGTNDATDWHFVSMVRYRSRRDLMEAATYEGFPGAHLFKTAAMEKTFNFPTQTRLQAFFGPALLVPLLLFFAAALIHLTLLVRRSSRRAHRPQAF